MPRGVEAGQSDDFLKEVKARIPLWKDLQRQMNQDTLLLLLSNASAFRNGTIITVEVERCVW